MAAEILNIVTIADSTAEDDEILVLYETPGPFKTGTTKSDAIPVDNYRDTPKRAIDLPQFDDEVILLPSFPKTLKKGFFKGESSNSKSEESESESGIIIPTTFTCEICADEKPVENVFRVLGCNHSYCSDCMSKYIGTKLQDNISNINCPVLGCDGRLEPQQCRSILPKEVFDRWGDALCEAVILATERFYCPYKDCSALLIDDRSGGDGEGVLESECPDCHRLFCVKCKVPWHVGIVCEEFQKLTEGERSNEDIMLMNLAKSKKWMRCPQCMFYVERSQGCLFMRCRCGNTFCYNCGAQMKEHFCSKCKH